MLIAYQTKYQAQLDPSRMKYQLNISAGTYNVSNRHIIISNQTVKYKTKIFCH